MRQVHYTARARTGLELGLGLGLEVGLELGLELGVGQAVAMKGSHERSIVEGWMRPVWVLTLFTSSCIERWR